MQPDFQTIAWQGFSLQVPRHWNLTLHRGNAKLGAIVLSDLHQSQLEIRWQTLPPHRVQPQADRLIKRLAKYPTQPLNIPVDWSIRHAHRLDRGDLTILLLQTPSRLYELSLKRSTTELTRIARSFRDHASRAHWPWQLYGLSGTVPKTFRLRKTTLLPGRTQLDFSAFRRRISLGSWSLADRLLADRSLRQWAAGIPLVKNHPAGTWQSDGLTERFTLTRGKLLPSRTLLSLTHLPAENLIRWEQTIG